METNQATPPAASATTPCSALEAAEALIAFGPCRGSLNPARWMELATPLCPHCIAIENVDQAAGRIVLAELNRLRSTHRFLYLGENACCPQCGSQNVADEYDALRTSALGIDRQCGWVKCCEDGCEHQGPMVCADGTDTDNINQEVWAAWNAHAAALFAHASGNVRKPCSDTQQNTQPSGH